MKDGKKQIIQNQSWTYVGRKFKYFDEVTNDDFKWEELKIFIKTIDSREEMINKIEEFCGFCRNVFTTRKNNKKICGHLYHKQCEIMMKDIFNVKCYLCNK